MATASDRFGSLAQWLISFLLLWLAAPAHAQPEPPALPTTKDVPELPLEVEAGAPSEPKDVSAPSLDTAASEGAEVGPPPSTQRQSAVLEGVRDIDLQIDDKPAAPSGDLPASLPKALRNSARRSGKAAAEQERTQSGLTIEEIVNPPISSVSNMVEGALKAPAWTIILTSRDLAARGYTDLSQILDDLPGMDVIRTYGVEYARAYSRGYRSDIGKDPYLILIDGQPYTSVYFADSQILTAIPLSNIDHIEVVYGPASVAHGANAATGLINIVTVDGAVAQQEKQFGARSRVFMTFGGAQRNLPSFSDATKIIDGTASWISELWRLRVSARVERSVLDRSIGENFEFLKRKYYADRMLWGSVLDAYPDRAGQFRSVNDKLALDARVNFGGLEVGGAILMHTTGNGTEFSADVDQPQGSWTSVEKSAWLRYTAEVMPSVVSTSLLRYRQSSIDPASFYIYRESGDASSPAGVVLENETVDNRVVAFQQQLDISVAHDWVQKGDSLVLSAGLSLRDLEVGNDLLSPTSIFYPNGDVENPDNRSLSNAPAPAAQHGAEDAAVFVLGKYALSPAHAFHVGGRLQHLNDGYFGLKATPLVLRAGYVGTFGPVTVKALYGEGTVAPSPFELSRVAQGDHLSNTTTRSLEANGTVMLGPASLTLSAWKMDYRDQVVFDTSMYPAVAFNADRVAAAGIDAGARVLFKQLQAWLYYSRYLQSEERHRQDDAWAAIGDLSRDKLWAGVTYDASRFSATLLGRFAGRRHTVATNPLGQIPWYLTLDVHVMLKDVVFPGVTLALRCANLLDTKYSHPGIGAANSGSDPTVVDRGDYNSALPQPRRSLYLTLGLDL